jgi:capsular polysaccharide biosynthesis protein
MELRRYLVVLRRRWLLVVLAVAAGLASSYAFAPKRTVYTAQSTIVVGPRQFSTQLGSPDLSGDRTVGINQLTQTYAVLIASAPIASEAIRAGNIPRSVGAVVDGTRAFAVPGTQLLRVQFTDPDPAVAQAVATGVAKALVDKVDSFQPDKPAAEGSLPVVPVYVFEDAPLPTVPEPTGLKSRVVVGGLFGLLAAVGLVVVLEYLDITLKTAEDVERRLELPVLAVIPILSDAGPGRGQPGRHRTLVDLDRQSA